MSFLKSWGKNEESMNIEETKEFSLFDYIIWDLDIRKAIKL